MDNPFFKRPILNSPYEYPSQHWELDPSGQPTQQIIGNRRRAEFITPIPKPRKRKDASEQTALLFDEGKGLSSEAQQYDHTAIIKGVRQQVDQWRRLPDPNRWQVTPETARLLHHWRHHRFSDIRPFFCQIEAVETAIWLIEVAPQLGKAAQNVLDHLANANRDANPELMRLALKLATGAGKTTVMAMLIAWQTVNAVRHPRVKAYVKNHNLGLEVSYRYGSEMRKYLPDFIILVDDGHGDLLRLIVEIKGYRREDAKEKKTTMEIYWVPGVNNLRQHGRWAFAEFGDVYEMQQDFAKKIEAEFNKMIEAQLSKEMA
jgi:hypothetical protein